MGVDTQEDGLILGKMSGNQNTRSPGGQEDKVSGDQNGLNSGESKEQKSGGMLRKLKTRLSIRGKKGETKKDTDVPKDVLPNDDSKVVAKERESELKDGESDDKEAAEEKTEGFVRKLKTRLSVRGKKEKTESSKDTINGKANIVKVEEVKDVIGDIEPNKKDKEKEEADVSDIDKENSDNAFLRMLRKLSFRKKKEKSKVEDEITPETVDESCDKTMAVEEIKVKKEVAMEELAVERRVEARPVSMAGRPPPAPPGRTPRPRAPCSATDLDARLKQFKLSTAESRESLRMAGSRQDLREVEEVVGRAVGSLSRQGSLRRGAGLSGSIPVTLSISLQELRATQA